MSAEHWIYDQHGHAMWRLKSSLLAFSKHINTPFAVTRSLWWHCNVSGVTISLTEFTAALRQFTLRYVNCEQSGVRSLTYHFLNRGCVVVQVGEKPHCTDWAAAPQCFSLTCDSARSHVFHLFSQVVFRGPSLEMTLQWTVVASFLYVEIGILVILCLPFISARRWVPARWRVRTCSCN